MNQWLRENRFLVVFALLASVMGTSVGTAKIATSLYALSLGATPAQLGLIASGQMVGLLVMSVPIGFLVDHHGPARLFVIGSVLAGIAYALIPIVATPAFLLGCVTAISFFMPMRFVSLNSVFFEQIRTLGEGKAGWYRGTHMTGMYLVGPSLAVALIAWAGYRGTWWLIAASFAVTIALSPIVLSRYARRHATSRRPTLAEVRSDLGTLARDPELRQINVIDAVTQATNAFHATFVIAIALNVFHLTAGAAAAYVTANGLAFILTLFAGGAVVVQLGPRRAYLAGFVLSGTALVALALATNAAWLWPGVLTLGVGLGLLQIVTLTRVARVGARLGQGKVSGLNLIAGPSGALIGTTVGGWFGEVFGLQNAYFLFVPAFALLGVWYWRSTHLAAPGHPRAGETASPSRA